VEAWRAAGDCPGGDGVPGCGGCPLPIGIPSQPPQALIDAACKDLTVTDGIGLQILFKHFDDILLDGVHNGDT